MRAISRLFYFWIPVLFVVAGLVKTSTADDQRYPQFVPGPSRISGDHCDTFFVQVRAELPNSDHPNDANIRYHLVSGPGEIDERTGLWSWHPGTSEYEWWQRIEIAASIGNSPVHMTPPDEYRRFTVSVEDEYGHVFLDGKPANSVFFVTAPGVHRFDMEVIDPDECDTLPVELFRVTNRPAGSFFIEDDELVFQAEPADHDKKFLVRLLLPTGPALLLQEFIFDTQENPMPVFHSCPEDLIVTPCDRVRIRLDVGHVEPGLLHGIECELISGPGQIERGRLWEFEPTEADIGQTYEVEISARYAHLVTTGEENCRFSVTVIEEPLGINPLDFTCGDSLAIPVWIESRFRMRAIGEDCERLAVQIIDISPPFEGFVDIVDYKGATSPNSETHNLVMKPDTADIGGVFDIVFEGLDDFSSERYVCSLTVVVEAPQPYHVRIETLENVQQGGHAYVDVVLEEGSIPMGRFDFVVAYDASVIAVMVVSPGPFIEQCDWKLFEYRLDPYGPAQGGLPSGQIRITGRAHNGYDGFDPTCFLPDSLPATLFTIDFLITNDRTFECDSVPIEFYWQRCYDNRIQTVAGRDGFISREVYDSEGGLLYSPDSLPSYSGATDSCLDDTRGGPKHRLINFYSGGIHIACDSVGWCQPGDLNRNLVPFEIADAVHYANYFVQGPSIFNDTSCIAQRSDANQDGIPLTIEDLQFLIRTIVGDAGPYYKLDVTSSPDPAFFRQEAGGVVSVATPDTLGAAWMVFDGAVAPTLLANGMEMRYAYNDSITRVLVFSYEGYGFVAGPLLGNVNAQLLEVQTCTYRAGKVEAIIDQVLGVDVDEDLLPTEFALGQNYPNPFNNSTVIQFALPQASDVTVTIYNIIGQALFQRTRYYEAGRHDFVWDGRSGAGEDVAGGVYFYRMQAGSFTETKKMLLLK